MSGVYIAHMSKAEPRTIKRRRNLYYADSVHEIAKELAYERRCEGGVSELFTRLVLAERKRKRGVASRAKLELINTIQ